VAQIAGNNPAATTAIGERPMSLSTLLIALVLLFIIATVPVWPYSRSWGIGPSGAFSLLLVVLVGLLVMS
jgi:high-affinity K+ transport system ATPase subunit B